MIFAFVTAGQASCLSDIRIKKWQYQKEDNQNQEGIREDQQKKFLRFNIVSVLSARLISCLIECVANADTMGEKR